MFDGQPKQIIIYQTVDGTEPFNEWLTKLRDAEAVGRIEKRLNRLLRGNPGDYKTVGNGVYELRIDYGPGYRLYCALAGQQIVLLLCGGDKRTQTENIKQALKYWRDYQRRNKP